MRFSLIFLSLSLLLIARDFVEGAKLNFVASLTEKQSPLDVRSESLKGCSMSSLNKCYGSLPPDGSRPNNLLEEIGQVSDAQTCQSFCKDLYRGSCAWFIFDRTTNDCKLFSGSLDDLRADCKEVGYAKEPNHSSCDTVFASNSSNGCYNFREDYCRFEFSLLENLEDIETLSECQLACQYINNCSYFVYDAPTKICKLNTIASSRPICDIIHGTPEPNFNTCVNDGHLDWASNQNNPQTGQSSTNGGSPVDCLWGSYGEWSTCSKTCGGGERTRTRNETTPASNGGQECEGDSTETENCNQEECPLECSSYTKIHDGKFCDGMRGMGDRDDNGGLFSSAEKCFEYITNPNSKNAKECDGLYFGWNNRDFWNCRCSTSGCSTLVNSGSDTYETDCQQG